MTDTTVTVSEDARELLRDSWYACVQQVLEADENGTFVDHETVLEATKHTDTAVEFDTTYTYVCRVGDGGRVLLSRDCNEQTTDHDIDGTYVESLFAAYDVRLVVGET